MSVVRTYTDFKHVPLTAWLQKHAKDCFVARRSGNKRSGNPPYGEQGKQKGASKQRRLQQLK